MRILSQIVFGACLTVAAVSDGVPAHANLDDPVFDIGLPHSSDDNSPIAIPEGSMNLPPIPADSNGLDFSPPLETKTEQEPTPPVDNDQELPSRSSTGITTDACTEAMSTICKLGDSYTFAESLRCLEAS